MIAEKNMDAEVRTVQLGANVTDGNLEQRIHTV